MHEYGCVSYHRFDQEYPTNLSGFNPRKAPANNCGYTTNLSGRLLGVNPLRIQFALKFIF